MLHGVAWLPVTRCRLTLVTYYYMSCQKIFFFLFLSILKLFQFLLFSVALPVAACCLTFHHASFLFIIKKQVDWKSTSRLKFHSLNVSSFQLFLAGGDNDPSSNLASVITIIMIHIIYKTKHHWMRGGPFMLKGRPGLAEWFTVWTHHSLTGHWGKGERGPIQHK